MPSTAETLTTALRHHQAGELDTAERLYGDILDAEPEHAETLHLLGVMAYQRGRPEDAVTLFRRAIAANGEVGKYHGNLGAVLATLGRYREALTPLETATALDPGSAEAFNSLGAVQRPLGLLADAKAAFETAIALAPDYAQPYANLAIVHLSEGRRDAALDCAERAVALDPLDADAGNNLALVLRSAGRRDEAQAELERAVALAPTHAEAVRNLGVVLLEGYRPTAALGQFHRLAALRPDDGVAEINQAHALRMLGRIDEAVQTAERAMARRPGNAAYRSAWLDTLTASPAATGQSLFDAHNGWNDSFAMRLAESFEPVGEADPDRRLKLGYVLTAPPQGAASAALAAVLRAHDRDGAEVTLYRAAPVSEQALAPLADAADNVRDIAALPDDRAAAAIRQDGIDVLVDLAGHGLRNRLLIFARRAAPVQVTWSDYGATTGLAVMDALIGDPVATPDGEDAVFAETVCRLPNAARCFVPPDGAPEIGERNGGDVAFGGFGPPGSLTGPVIERWAGIVKDVPGARLRIASPLFGEPETAAAVVQAFADHGLDPDRLDLQEQGGLDFWSAIDVGLDPFPRSDPWSLLEALWMGVPVVSLAGERMAARAGASILTALNLTHLVTETALEYGALARSLGGEAAQLGALRTGFRDRLAASPICDIAGFTRDLEAAYRAVWRRYCGVE